jgi:hypothetical protein
MSFEERILVFAIARLAKDCLAALRAALTDVVPDRAVLSSTGITITAPPTVGVTSRDNSIEQRMDLSPMGPLSRPIRGDIGVSLDLPAWYSDSDAAGLAYWAFDRIMTDVGAIEPDEGLDALGQRLGLRDR